MKKISAVLGALAAAAVMFTGCQKQDLIVGFVQAGHESAWRIANTESFEQAFGKDSGYILDMHDCNGSRDLQIEVIRKLLDDGVDYLVIAPVVEDGWEEVLHEAKEADVPVILCDRQISADSNLYECWVGSYFVGEGRNAVNWLENYLKEIEWKKERTFIVHLQGTKGSSAQKGRTQGLEEGLRNHPEWKLLGFDNGNFSESGGYIAMKKIIASIGIDMIDVVYAENDDMAIGAVEAIRETGKEPGKDIIIISFDAGRRALELVKQGVINCDVECNPMHGPLVKNIIDQKEKGIEPEKIMNVKESLYDITNVDEVLETRTY
ncbi:LacI family transcriptional regulator [Treponema rectale]|uniref:LacI family transcriptional regulator n=1 Tax=Treponema rectale TaxID=744512 RepID=A0A840SH90_9SPIR|nr:ABC transporter substrate-binding protein [Treponema rectale]MBB5220065.1 simple sugar transport system substrate-binding protein [Treponema rectale]QOS40623.1 LacI family transcriptional regulator [Treponema rectale]